LASYISVIICITSFTNKFKGFRCLRRLFGYFFTAYSQKNLIFFAFGGKLEERKTFFNTLSRNFIETILLFFSCKFAKKLNIFTSAGKLEEWKNVFFQYFIA